MSETATGTPKRNGWALGRVIRATAHATVAAYFDRIRAEGLGQAQGPLHGCEASTQSNANPNSDSEVKHLLRIHDELVKLISHSEARAGTSKRQRRRLGLELRLVAGLIARILDRLQELRVARMQFPDVVDFRLHEPVRITPTHTLADDGRVTDVYIHGFTSNGRVVRQAKVAVLKYLPKPELQPGKENKT